MEMFNDITDLVVASNLIFVYIDWFFVQLADILPFGFGVMIFFLLPGLISRIMRDSI